MLLGIGNTSRLFGKLSRKSLLVLPAWIETANQYDGSKCSWYVFNLNGVQITVGWRKRVVSITIGKPMAVSLSALGKRDDVTHFEDNGSYTIHAWNKEKCIEYMVAACKECLGQ